MDAWTRLLITALGHPDRMRTDPALTPLKAPLAFATAAAFDRVRDPDRVPDLDLAPGFETTQALALAQALGLDVGVGVEIDAVVGVARDSDLELAHNRALALARSYGLTDTTPALADALDGALRRAHPLGDSTNLGLERALTRAQNFRFGHALGLAPARERIPGLGPDHSQALDLALNLAFDATHSPESEVPIVALAACRAGLTAMSLISVSEPAAPAHFDDLLSLAAANPRSGSRAPEDPAGAVDRVRTLIGRIEDSTYGSSAANALELLDGVSGLLIAMRDRTAPSDSRTLPCARTALLATLADLQRTGPTHPHREECLRFLQAMDLLNATWQSLITLDHPGVAQTPPNQILLVTRTRP